MQYVSSNHRVAYESMRSDNPNDCTMSRDKVGTSRMIAPMVGMRLYEIYEDLRSHLFHGCLIFLP
jgi:hypothetical protein